MYSPIHFAAPLSRRRDGYTLIELLVATALALLLLAGVVQVFATVSSGMSNARSLMEKGDQLRATRERLILDIGAITPPLDKPPPLDPEASLGYFEYTEGPIGPLHQPWGTTSSPLFTNSATGGEQDSTIGDVDDILMFTARSKDRPFIGRVLQKRSPLPGETPHGTDDPDGGGPLPAMPYVFVRTAESADAEVAWFLRGRTLYRRVLLIIPDFDADLRTRDREMQLVQDPTDPTKWNAVKGDVAGPGFFVHYDLSVRLDPDTNQLVPNTLSDLTKPENRYAHRTWDLDVDAGTRIPGVFPFHPHSYYEIDRSAGTWVRRRTAWSVLGLPTARETSFIDTDGVAPDTTWNARTPLPMIPFMPPAAVSRDLLTARSPLDLWTNPHVWQELDPLTGTVVLDDDAASVDLTDPFQGSRLSEDVILSNVVGFDVKVWDPGAPVLVRDFGIGLNPRYASLVPGDPGYLDALASSVPPTASLNPPEIRRVSYGAFVDLNYMCRLGPSTSDPSKPLYWDKKIPAEPEPSFYGAGERRSQLRGHDPDANPPADYSDLTTWPLPSVYDTWSTHYEMDGINQDRDLTPIHTPNPPPQSGYTTTWEPLVDEATNGFDDDQGGVNDDGVGGVDDPPGEYDGIIDGAEELETLPPYPVALQGLQVKIRVYEPDSRQIRETTIVHEFMEQ